MSTQHPDNVRSPFFADSQVVRGEAEIREAYYAYSHLGCTEQMWDYEGKEVDPFVVKKLFSRYGDYFGQHQLGEDLFLTLRVPNPRVEKLEGKVLLETLESIPRCFDVARLFYSDDTPPPVFEVILPMTTCAAELNRVDHYYREFVGGKERQRCFDRRVGEWVGEFRPDCIHVIPLIEDREHLETIDQIVEEYVADKGIPRQRVFLARSDPALNYGQVSAVLLAKIALQRLDQLEHRLGVELLPILGAGSAPFRGNLRPPRVRETLAEYPSVQTFTIQSAFKYDYEQSAVRDAVTYINDTPRGQATPIDEARAKRIIDKLAARYAECVHQLAPLVNDLASHVPQRRARKLHVGLFGYSRTLNGGKVHLPRAITFCAALYSVGLPPEVLGLSALDSDDLAFLRRTYVQLDHDMQDSMRFLSVDESKLLPDIVTDDVRTALRLFPVEPDTAHDDLTRSIREEMRDGNARTHLTEKIVAAAARRQFLG